AELAELERRQRRGRGRLGHDRVAGEQGRADLDRQQDQRDVPRGDRRDDAERLAHPDHLPGGVLVEYLRREVERGVVAARGDRELDLAERLRQRLALLLGEQPGERALVRFEGGGQPGQQTRPHAQGERRPRQERFFRRSNRLLELGPIRARR